MEYLKRMVFNHRQRLIGSRVKTTVSLLEILHNKFKQPVRLSERRNREPLQGQQNFTLNSVLSSGSNIGFWVFNEIPGV